MLLLAARPAANPLRPPNMPVLCEDLQVAHLEKGRLTLGQHSMACHVRPMRFGGPLTLAPNLRPVRMQAPPFTQTCPPLGVEMLVGLAPCSGSHQAFCLSLLRLPSAPAKAGVGW